MELGSQTFSLEIKFYRFGVFGVALQFDWELALKKGCCRMFGHSGDNSTSFIEQAQGDEYPKQLGYSEFTPSSYLDRLDFFLC